MTVKELQEKLKEFPENVDILVTPLRQSTGYYKLKDIGKMNVLDPIDDSEFICPVLVFS